MSDTALTTALVTGASDGLGRAIATALAPQVSTLVLVARREELLQQLAAELAPTGATIVVRPCDLSAEDQLEALAGYLAECEPAVDILVNCAGIRNNAPFVTSKPASWQAELQVNLLAPMHLAQAFGKRLRRLKQPGCLINIASVAAFSGVPGASLYCASKGALVSWGRALALEWAKQNIRVVTIAPGFVRTEMLERTRRLLPPGAWEKVEESHPLGLGNPEDIANLVVAVVGPAGRWMTGNVIVSDGGYLAQ